MRKGELSKARIDRDWPHQVALPASKCWGSQHLDHAAKVFCFADADYARQFRERFGGEEVDPKTRPKWPGNH